MTDDLDRLGAAMRATPAPDAGRKAAALRAAMDNFDRLQDQATGARPNSDNPRWSGVWSGVRDMLDTLTSRPILAATTSVAALCLGLVVVLPLQNGPLTLTLPTATPEARSDAPRQPTVTGQIAAQPQAPISAAEEHAMTEADSLARNESASLTDTAPARTKQASSDSGLTADVAEGIAAAPAVAPLGDLESFAAEGGMAPPAPANTEAFANTEPNTQNVTAENPVSTFSIDVDTASYAVVRSFLMAGALPPPEAVRIEEMVNYFPYAYPAPDDGAAFRPDIAVMPTPWNPGTRLVRIGLQGQVPPLANRPPLNLVFLIDTSGSMQDANKLPLLKQGFRLMLGQLRPQDQVAIVAYAGSAGEVLAPTPASDRAAILAALDRLDAGGSTGGAEGLELAYRVAQGMTRDGEVSRVLLATDGDFNVGLADPSQLEDFIATKRETGVYLSVLGFGRGNLDDATLQALAQAGNGTAAYIDTAQEARKVLVDQLSGALFPIADDVKIQVEWNPAAVAEWRLIGYETRALNREDFSNDRVDAGEIGAGTAVTALYEVTAPGSAALRNAPLRYGTAPTTGETGELGFLRLRWKAPGADISTLIETPILRDTGPASDDTRFAAAVAGMGQLLTGARYLNDWGWDQAAALAEGARGVDAFGYRAEAVTLMRLAQSLAQP